MKKPRKTREEIAAYMAAYRVSHAEERRRWRQDNRERVRDAARAWRHANPDKIREHKRREYAKDAKKINAKSKAWYQKNKERVSAEKREHYAENRVAIAAQAREWRKANPALVKLWREANRKKRRAAYLRWGVKKSAKACGVDFDITVEWLDARLKAGICEMSGLPFDMESKRGPNSPSVDRIKAGGPYTQANCRLILWSLNRALSNYGDDYMLMVFEHILALRRSKLTQAA